MLKIQTTLILVVVLLVATCAPAVRAQSVSASVSAPRERYSFERYLNIRSATSPTLSPTGDRIAFLTNITGTAQVWMVPAAGGWPEQLTFFQDRVDFVEWSPDGTGLVFGKARGGDENAQLYWMSPDGAEIKPLTDAPKIRHNFGSWSHDGRRISYASNKRNPNFFDIYVMEVATGREELVYQQDGSNNPVAWSFDDNQIIVSHTNEQLSLDNDLLLVDLRTKQATPLTPHTDASQFSDVRALRGANWILLGTNVGRENYSLARMDTTTRRIEILDDTSWELDGTELSDDGRLLAYTINHDGYSELYVREVGADGTLGVKSAPIQMPGQGVIGGLEFTRDNRKLAFVFNGARFNSDVWLYDLTTRALTQVTRSSRAGIPQSAFVEPQLIRYRSFDGKEIPAWYYRPQVTASIGTGTSTTTTTPGPQSATVTINNGPVTGTATINVTAGSITVTGAPPATAPGSAATVRVGAGLPVIVSVHGGPEGQERPTFNANYQYYLARGYAVLAPNVRGSTGYGKTYTHLDDVRNREDSVKDLAAAVEWLKTQGGADPRRIAVMGGSYGGYMTLAAITLYPELWAAAVNTVGIANFESFLKNTSGYRRKLREVEYGSLERDLEFLRSISPLHRVERIRTPLLVIHGRNDPRVPYTEAEQIVEALRRRGAPVEYKLFDDEGHGVSKLTNRLIVGPLTADFLDRYLK